MVRFGGILEPGRKAETPKAAAASSKSASAAAPPTFRPALPAAQAGQIVLRAGGAADREKTSAVSFILSSRWRPWETRPWTRAPRTARRTSSDTMMEPGLARACSRAATLTPWPKRSPDVVA